MSDEFNKLFDKLEKADVRFNMIVKMSLRIKELEEYIAEQGDIHDQCTYNILNKKICNGCRCGEQK